VYIR